MIKKIHLRADVKNNWSTANPTLESGEIGVVQENLIPDPNTNILNKWTNAKIAYSDSEWNNIPYQIPNEIQLSLNGILNSIDDTTIPSSFYASVGYYLENDYVSYYPQYIYGLETQKYEYGVAVPAKYIEYSYTPMANRLELVTFLDEELNINNDIIFFTKDGGLIPGTNNNYYSHKVYIKNNGIIYGEENQILDLIDTLWVVGSSQYQQKINSKTNVMSITNYLKDNSNNLKSFFKIEIRNPSFQSDNDVYNVEDTDEKYSFQNYFKSYYEYVLQNNYINDINSGNFKIIPINGELIKSIICEVKNTTKLSSYYYWFFKYLSLYPTGYFSLLNLTFDDANKSVTLNPMSIAIN